MGSSVVHTRGRADETLASSAESAYRPLPTPGQPGGHLMISWAVMGYGAVLSVLLAAVLTAIPKPRQAKVIATAAVAAGLGALAWNAILPAAHGANFLHRR